MTVLRAHHVQLAMPAGGESAARSFYAGLLGLAELDKPEHLRARGGCWFEIGQDLQLHLGVEAPFRPAAKAHLALVVADLEATRSALVGGGLPVIEDTNCPASGASTRQTRLATGSRSWRRSRAPAPQDKADLECAPGTLLLRDGRPGCPNPPERGSVGSGSER